ncbi:hypothetical protein [Streptomyces boncukensis]|uniref:Uncharacterized protein n=1 Tax=Streptomyces boncukensis TaxID=2711219 RepID=A0A6G4WUB1_9ACTN|nr:hypothetical protein [Streptomyces boncukensis]NGO68220.1 hypothetical protein [Streptomyces boncukensis]
MAEGFARVDGSLALLVQRSEQTDKALDDHDKRITNLEHRQWPLPSLAALVGVAGLGLSLWQITH